VAPSRLRESSEPACDKCCERSLACHQEGTVGLKGKFHSAKARSSGVLARPKDLDALIGLLRIARGRAGHHETVGWALGSAVEGLASLIVVWRFTGSRNFSKTAERRAQRASPSRSG
jgi:hypothetical protein